MPPLCSKCSKAHKGRKTEDNSETMGALKGRTSRILTKPEKCAGCWRCQLTCSWNFLGRFSPLEAWIKVQRTGSGYDYQISFTEDCTNCGLCVESCSFGALSLAGAS